MRKADIQRSYHQGHNGDPMVNVKAHIWWPDLVRQFKGSKEHEHGDHAEFWRWALERDEQGDLDDSLDTAWRMACENAWDDAREYAMDIFGPRAKVWSAGRSGGWLVVEGLPDIECWDAIDVSRWAKFQRAIEALRDDIGYQTVWNLAVNIFEAEREWRFNYYRKLAG